MELNWSTFLLEIVNFLVLLWILKRFLYRPIISVLETRRQKIEQSLSEASAHHQQAVELEQQYNNRLKNWEREKQQLKESLQQELQSERSQQLKNLQAELDSEREKTAVVEQRHLQESLRLYQQNSHKQAAVFASRLLREVASEDLESRLFDLCLKALDALDEAQKNTLHDACEASSASITVTSAYPLSEAKQQQLQSRLDKLCDQSVSVKYTRDTELVAGLRLHIGASVVGLNLQDELSGFAELAIENK